MNNKIELIKKIIKKRDELEPLKFRLLIESIVKEKDPEVINYIATLSFEKDLPKDLRSNLIRVMGYSQVPAFLFPLKKIAESDPDINLRKEAIIAISKFNDRKAYNTLNLLLKTVENKNLLQMVHSVIEKIKQNNPVLSLLPRFLKGSSDPKTSTIAKDILKKILPKDDVKIFYQYLLTKDPTVSSGAFEIICFAGDKNSNSYLLEYIMNLYAKLKSKKIIDEQFFDAIELYTSFLEKTKSLIKDNKDIKFFELLLNEFKNETKKLSTIAPILLYIEDRKTREKAYSLFKEIKSTQKEIAKHLGVFEEDFDFIGSIFYSVNKDIREILIKRLRYSKNSSKRILNLYTNATNEIKIEIIKNITCKELQTIESVLKEDLKSEDVNFLKQIFNSLSDSGCRGVLKILKTVENKETYKEIISSYIKAFLSLSPYSGVLKFLKLYNSLPQKRAKLKTLFSYIEDVLSKKPFGFLQNELNEELQKFNSHLEPAFLKLAVSINSSIVPIDTDTANIQKNFFKELLKEESTSVSLQEIKKANSSLEEYFSILFKIEENRERIKEFLTQNRFIKKDDFEIFIKEPVSFFEHKKELFDLEGRAIKNGTSNIDWLLKLFEKKPFLLSKKNSLYKISITFKRWADRVEKIEALERNLRVFTGDFSKSCKNILLEFLELMINDEFSLTAHIDKADIIISKSSELLQVGPEMFANIPTVVLLNSPEEYKTIKDHEVSYLMLPLDFVRFYTVFSVEIQKWVKL